MASTRADNRAAVLQVLEDRKWHGLGELLYVGGSRAPGRVHELRRGEDEGGTQRRILNRVRASQSEYRWVCGCGPVPKDPDWSIVPHCADCEPVLYEMGIAVPGYVPPVPASVAPTMAPPPLPPAEEALPPASHHAQQLALFGMAPAREGSR